MRFTDAQEVAFVAAVRRMTDSQREITQTFMEAWASGQKNRELAVRFAKAFNDNDDSAGAFANRLMEAE